MTTFSNTHPAKYVPHIKHGTVASHFAAKTLDSFIIGVEIHQREHYRGWFLNPESTLERPLKI